MQHTCKSKTLSQQHDKSKAQSMWTYS